MEKRYVQARVQGAWKGNEEETRVSEMHISFFREKAGVPGMSMRGGDRWNHQIVQTGMVNNDVVSTSS